MFGQVLIPNHDLKRWLFTVLSVIPIGLRKFATLLPNNWLDETPKSFDEVTWQTVGGKGAESENNWNVY
ncbi:hypothetical protein ABIE66_005553 [Peribacillus sp. B2I2]|uniref:hypothetical protein n=1 Tax=Peribacillus sp. B2I2 TaxID=3156468 RepID=UPI003516EBCE